MTYNFIIGGNDEHGLNPPTAGKRTPIMPYLNVQIYENQFNVEAKRFFFQACLRNGLNIYDVKPEVQDVALSTRVRRVNSQNLTCLVTFAYNAFGTGQTFNSANGFETFFSNINPRAFQSRQLAEEIFEQLSEDNLQRARRVDNLNIAILSQVNCPSALVEAGFMTNLTEAGYMLDPDFQVRVAECSCEGVCKWLGIPYIARNDLSVYPTLRLGSTGNFVELLQYILTLNGYNITVDGIMGSRTVEALRNFQQKNGLQVDGIAGPMTWKTMLFLPPYPTLRQGNRGVYVQYLQYKLQSKLYPTGTADGIFGPNTLSAVQQFQKDNNLTVDGIVGPRTWEKLTPIKGGQRPTT